MIYIDGDSCMYGAGIGQELYGYKQYYTGREIFRSLKNKNVQKVNVDMNKKRAESSEIADEDRSFIKNNNVSAHLIKKGFNVTTKASGGSSNQAIASRIVDAIIRDNHKTIIFCPTNLQRVIYPRPNAQSLTVTNVPFSKEYENYMRKWVDVFSIEQTTYLETNALLGLISFCKDNNVELLGVKTLIWQLVVQDKKWQSKEINRIIDQVSELCIFDMGSNFHDNKKRILHYRIAYGR